MDGKTYCAGDGRTPLYFSYPLIGFRCTETVPICEQRARENDHIDALATPQLHHFDIAEELTSPVWIAIHRKKSDSLSERQRAAKTTGRVSRPHRTPKGPVMFLAAVQGIRVLRRRISCSDDPVKKRYRKGANQEAVLPVTADYWLLVTSQSMTSPSYQRRSFSFVPQWRSASYLTVRTKLYEKRYKSI